MVICLERACGIEPSQLSLAVPLANLVHRLELSDTSLPFDRHVRIGLTRSEFWCVLDCTGRFTTSVGMHRDRDAALAGMDSWVWQRALSLSLNPVSLALRA